MKRLKIYDIMRVFHKNKLFPLLDKHLDNEERNALEALSGVLYLVEKVFAEDK